MSRVYPTTHSALTFTSHSFYLTRQSAIREHMCETILWEFKEGYLAREQLGGLEHNSKVNSLNRVALTLS